MSKRRLSKLFSLVLGASLLFTACASSDGTTTPVGTSGTGTTTASATSGSDTTPGDTSASGNYKSELNIAITANLPSLDAHSSNSNLVGGLISHTNEPLFAMNESFEPTPVLAESYEVSEDGLVYTIKLREGIQFHNGVEMVADDVVASMTRWLELSGKANALLKGSVFAEVDDYTITMTLPEAYTDTLNILAGSAQFAAIYPSSVINSAGAEGITEVMGTGPYKFVEWKQDQYVHLTRFDGYQPLEGEASGFVGKKEAATRDIYFRVVTDEATRVAGLQTGEYDIAEAIPTERYQELSADPSMELLAKPTGNLSLFLNTTKGIMADQNMRKAILAALNTEDIMLASFGDPSLYMLNAGWANPNDAQWATEAGSEFYNQNDLDKARGYLADAGYNNEEIVLVTTPDYGEMYNATIVVQAQLVAAGINAKVESFDFSTFMEYRANPDQFDLFITSNRYTLLPVQLSVLMKDWAGLDHPKIPESIAAIRSAATPEEAAAQWAELQTFLYDYGAASVLGHYSSVMATSPKTEGLIFFDYPLYWNVRVAE